jgi:hypothetical protein
METMKKMREIEIDTDMKIEEVQHAFILIAQYEYQLTKEDLDRVENLEVAWLALQSKAMKTQILLLEVQEHFQRQLVKNLGLFKEVGSSHERYASLLGRNVKTIFQPVRQPDHNKLLFMTVQPQGDN